MIKNIHRKIEFSFEIIAIIFLFFSFASISFASTEVYFQKEIGEVTKGDTFSVNLKISSSEKLVNVIDGTITYDKNILEIKKVKTDNSLLSLWVKEPIFNNDKGELSFVGGIPSGFKGKDGQILEITFFAKKDGSTLVGFKDIFSVLINDGLGTRINPWLKPLSLSIGKKSNVLVKNILNYFYPVNMNVNYKYYIGVFVLIILFIIIRLLIKSKKRRNDK